MHTTALRDETCAQCTVRLTHIKAKLQRLNELADDDFGIDPADAMLEQVAALGKVDEFLGKLLEIIESTEAA